MLRLRASHVPPRSLQPLVSSLGMFTPQALRCDKLRVGRSATPEPSPYQAFRVSRRRLCILPAVKCTSAPLFKTRDDSSLDITRFISRAQEKDRKFKKSTFRGASVVQRFAEIVYWPTAWSQLDVPLSGSCHLRGRRQRRGRSNDLVLSSSFARGRSLRMRCFSFGRVKGQILRWVGVCRGSGVDSSYQ